MRLLFINHMMMCGLHEIKRHKAGFDYRNLLYAYYKANADLNVTTAVSDREFEKYKVVYMPAHNVVTDKEVKRISEYVENGGTLVLTLQERDKRLL